MIVFYEIKGHEKYLINKNGEVFNTKTNRILKASSGASHGYLTVYVDGKNLLLHRLIAQTFVPNPNDLNFVNHKDGNKHNNSIDNLEWVTQVENNRHARRTGLNPYKVLYGEKSRHHKLNQIDVDFIKSHYKRYDKNYGARALSKKYNVTPSCICSIANGKSWEAVT